MSRIKFLSIFVLLALLLSAGSGAVLAQRPPRAQGTLNVVSARDDPSPLADATGPDDAKVPIYLVPEDVEVTRKALEAGIITKQEVARARELERELRRRRIPLCSNIANQRASGRDADDDYYKDYEHPEDWDYGYCVTAWYWLWDLAHSGPQPSSILLPPHYGPHLFRRRLIIGLSGFPDWFADHQAYLCVWQ